MRVDELLAAGPTRSFEFFPPRTDEEAGVLYSTMDALAPLSPSFVSVTYRGADPSSPRTFDLVTRIQREGRLTVMAHVVCAGHTRAELETLLRRYRDAGVENLMALGGDAAPGRPRGELAHADQLVDLAREVGDFSIGVAAHPAGHPASTSRDEDRRRMADKLARADFAITQFFFEARQWRDLVDDLAALGVTKPVVPGVMPVTSVASIPRMAERGAPVPDGRADRLRAAGDPASVRAAGVEAAVELCRDLVALGAPGLHFYTLNRSSATRVIHRALAG
ncbi:MAG TPA: methylenetetrahydrofolate reductase [Acidimicrobiales bacterium]|nr:methylenetetrahydrofolate reductase [Acidimicrobiales bacterium]